MKTIGILGGMGPLATADLFRKIIQQTQAENDNQHIHILVDNNTEIPDRTAAIVGGGADPLPELVRSALRLESMGADFLVMPCNTAHHYYDRVTPFLKIPFLHIVDPTLEELRERGVQTAALLATDGTLQAGVYERVQTKGGITLLTPTPPQQKIIMGLIYQGVKAGRKDYDTNPFRQVLRELLDAEAECLILGCTELPVAMSLYQIDLPALDPTSLLTVAAVKKAREEAS